MKNPPLQRDQLRGSQGQAPTSLCLEFRLEERAPLRERGKIPAALMGRCTLPPSSTGLGGTHLSFGASW